MAKVEELLTEEQAALRPGWRTVEQIFNSEVITGCAGGLLGRDPFSISDLSSGTLFLSLLGMPRHSPLSNQN